MSDILSKIAGRTGSIAKSALKYNNLQEMLNDYYGDADQYLGKVDAPVAIGTTGVRNVLYGAQLWAQVNVAANAFGALPKDVWEKSGFRAITAAAATAGAGIAETAAVPDTIKPTFAQIDVNPKLYAASTEMTLMEMAVEGRDDTITWEELMSYMKDEFMNRLDRALMTDNDTLAGNNIESLDRIVGSNSEIAGCGQTAGDLDIYSQDRDAAASWCDAYVNHNSNTDRTFALTQLDALFTQCRPFWNNYNGVQNKVLITGFDTLERIEQQIASQMRINVPTANVSFGVNGVQTLPGVEAGLDVSAYKKVPMIPDAFTTADTLSRAFLLDLDFIKFSNAAPIQYREFDDVAYIDRFGKMAVYYGVGEVYCKKFKCHGKLRDLK